MPRIGERIGERTKDKRRIRDRGIDDRRDIGIEREISSAAESPSII
jgi:hypothetical protein